MHYEIPTTILENLIAQNGTVTVVNENFQKSMAIEILKRRKIMNALERKMGALIEDNADLTALKTMLAGELQNGKHQHDGS
jgi:hypothetical protein